MTVDGQLIITSFKVDLSKRIVIFYDEAKQPKFSVELDSSMARIRHILPVKVDYVFDGEKVHITGILPFDQAD